MKIFALVALAAGFVSGAAALACSSGTKYCGSTAAGLSKYHALLPLFGDSTMAQRPPHPTSANHHLVGGWSDADVVAQIRDWPSGLQASWRDTLFKCEDHWYWEKADLHYEEACRNGCRNNGAGHDDSCA